MNEIIIESFDTCPLCKNNFEKNSMVVNGSYQCSKCGIFCIKNIGFNSNNSIFGVPTLSAGTNNIYVNSMYSMYISRHSKSLLSVIEFCEQYLYDEQNVAIRLSIINKSNNDKIFHKEIDLGKIKLPYNITSIYYDFEKLFDKYSINQDIL
ncbi:MAG: hypothetical protein LC122_12210 [Chitinophagales bacterium]|nr:hypothetical protein [Chitinophagales bacterium]